MDEQQLAEIEARAAAATPGPWYPILTDDEWYQGAVYIGLKPRGKSYQDNGLYVDDGRGQIRLEHEIIDSSEVLAITCLQYPDLVYQEQCDENAIFIAHARKDIPALVDEIRQLKRLLEIQPS